MKKKRSERRKHCARSQKFSPRRRPPSRGAQDGQNLISWRWPTNSVWWRLMLAISSYRGNKPTNIPANTQTNKQTHRQDQLQYTAPLSLARSASHQIPNTIHRVSPQKDKGCFAITLKVHKFPLNLADSCSNQCWTVYVKIIHSTWRVYTHYLVMLQETECDKIM